MDIIKYKLSEFPFHCQVFLYCSSGSKIISPTITFISFRSIGVKSLLSQEKVLTVVVIHILCVCIKNVIDAV